MMRVNVGNLLVVLGMGWLAFSFWLPYATAQRVYRIESRNEVVARAIRDVASGAGKIDWHDQTVRDRILAGVNERCGFIDPTSSLYIRPGRLPRDLVGHAFVFESKHYLFLLSYTPPHLLGERRIDRPEPARPDDAPTPPATTIDPGISVPPVPLPEDLALPLEVYGWPQRADEGARTVFFEPTDDRPAFARNLGGMYSGYRRMPGPGTARRRASGTSVPRGYRGLDNEPWLWHGAGAPRTG